MPTRAAGSWNEGTVRAEIDYDASNRIIGIRVINDSQVDAFLEIRQIASGRKYGGRFLAGTNTTIPIGTGAAVRITQTLNARGFWDGVEIAAQIPAP